MTEPIEIAVDPYLLCLSDPCLTEESIEGFVRGLLAWSESLRRDSVRVLVSDACRNALYKDGLYPYGHRLRELLRGFRVELADHETICRLVQSLLERTPSLEDYLGISYISFDDAKAIVEPMTFLQRLGNHTQLAFLEMLILLAGRYHCGPECEQRASLASAFNEGEEADQAELSVTAEVLGIDWHDVAYISRVPLPAEIATAFHVFANHEAFRHHSGPWKLWQNARTEEGARDAIEEVTRDLIHSGVDAAGRVNYSFGPRFLESACHWGFGARSDYAMVLIESCARIVLGQPKNAVNEFRVNANSNEQWKRSDGALAYRTHLTKKGPGFRLMLWRLPGGGVEFANVGDKDELEIF